MPSGTVIHPSAVVESGATLGEGVRVGALCYVGSHAVIGDNVEIMAQACILGRTTLGAGCRVFPHAVLGCEPQNVRHQGGPTTLAIGRNTTIREGATIHVGSDSDKGHTSVGENCFILGYAHIAHDCQVGNHVTLTQNALLGGHCEVGDHAIIGGLASVHQFTRIGHHAFVGGATGVERDLIPYGLATGNRARLRGLNIVGMKRAGIARNDIHALRAAYRLFFDPARPVMENVRLAALQFAQSAIVMDVVDFMTSGGKRLFCLPAVGDRASVDSADDAA